MERLLDTLREQLGLTGAKEGCGEGECGSCSVLMNGMLVNSCLIPILQAKNANVVTIEGLASGAQLSHLQEAFLRFGGAQCGICTPGMILAASHLLKKKPEPTLEESAKDCLEFFAAAPATFRSSKLWWKRRGWLPPPGPQDEIGPGQLSTGCAGQFAGGGLAAGRGSGRVDAYRRRHRCNGAVRGRETARAKTGQHLESSRAAAH